MKPVNLLPATQRGGSSAGRKGSSYVLLGVLGFMLVAGLLYVLSANQITTRQSDLARVQQETQQAQAKAQSLATFGNFAQIKQTRLDSVRSLASQRFDWERMAREVAQVLPAGVELTGIDASLSGAQAGQAGPAGAPDASPQPTLTLNGCAPGHPAVADTLVRLRRLHRAEDVTLTQSEKGAGQAGGEGGGASCSGKQSTAFLAVVKFEAAEVESANKKVPASLGGGA